MIRSVSRLRPCYHRIAPQGESQWESPLDGGQHVSEEKQRMLFDAADRGAKGMLDQNDLLAFVKTLGFDADEAYVEKALRLFGTTDPPGSERRPVILYGAKFSRLCEIFSGHVVPTVEEGPERNGAP